MRLPEVKIFHISGDAYLRDWANQCAGIVQSFGYKTEVVPSTYNGVRTYRPDTNPVHLQHDERMGENAIKLCMTMFEMYSVREALSFEEITESNN